MKFKTSGRACRQSGLIQGRPARPSGQVLQHRHDRQQGLGSCRGPEGRVWSARSTSSRRRPRRDGGGRPRDQGVAARSRRGRRGRGPEELRVARICARLFLDCRRPTPSARCKMTRIHTGGAATRRTAPRCKARRPAPAFRHKRAGDSVEVPRPTSSSTTAIGLERDVQYRQGEVSTGRPSRGRDPSTRSLRLDISCMPRRVYARAAPRISPTAPAPPRRSHGLAAHPPPPPTERALVWVHDNGGG